MPIDIRFLPDGPYLVESVETVHRSMDVADKRGKEVSVPLVYDVVVVSRRATDAEVRAWVDTPRRRDEVA